MKQLLLAAVLAALPLPSTAASWAVADLGRTDRNAHCLRAAQQTFRELLAEARIGAIRSDRWIVYADRINSGHDALITCTFGDGGGTRATLVIHSKTAPAYAQLLKRRIGHLFTMNARRIRREWVESFN